jgi:phosphate transport system substrate-binding protein
MKRNKKIAIVAIIIIIAAAFLVVTTSSAQKVDVVGSTSVQPVAEQLAAKYNQTHPGVEINVQGGGSSVGIKSAQDGTADIGTSSKEVKGNDSTGLKQYNLGKDGIVIAVNNKNGVSDLTTDQLKDIYSGKITNWNQVGGSSGKIDLITREEGSGTLDAFQKLVLGNSSMKKDAVVQSSTEAVKQSVAQDPNAIGFISYAHMSSDVKAINVNGVAPSDSSIADGSYKLQRPFLFLTKGEPTGETKKFIDWVMSDEGKKVLEQQKIVQANAK